ncbi:hypothetical protein B0G57_1108 [Trinickia symbiotica]|uniref:hypothetical protein n=1 Tax=Trinickia symbiotica TaxID=863227 RepID=UPI000CEC5648|nr:hypothetical protein [Trinickia symbiotica]PPK43936.1 hypothetical protein B0G57_1108 [Trinickia symbiotica]
MEMIRETEWRSFEEVLALALGWPMEDATELVKQYDAAAGEQPYEIPDPIEEVLANFDADAFISEEADAYFDPTEDEGSDAIVQASSFAGVDESSLGAYLHAKRMLIQAIQSKDIDYQYPPRWEKDACPYTILNPTHVSRWLNAMRVHDAGKLLERLAELEKENKNLRREIERRNKFKDDIKSNYLNIAIRKYYSTWHGLENPVDEGPSQKAVIDELQGEYDWMSDVAAKSIEKVICTIDRNLANKSKK